MKSLTTKENILTVLNKDDFVSGEELARKCDVSRVAVNKAINSLRNEGYSIKAITNKGYKILSEPDKISDLEIKSIIEKLGGNINNVFAFDSIDSTNTEAKRRCASIGAFRNSQGELTNGGLSLHRSVFAAGEQTAGRGRMGRVFVSPKNSGVYFTLVYSPKNGITNPALLTAAAAVAVSKSVDELYGTDTKIKWVNDVFLSIDKNDKNPVSEKDNFRKISGILTEGISNFETRRIEAAIVGIGINVRNGGFTGDLAKVAGSIEDILDNAKNVSRNEIIAHVIFHLLKYYDDMENSVVSDVSKQMMLDYKEKSVLIGKQVLVNSIAGLEGNCYKATVIDISDSAELVVQDENGEIKNLHSGEISLHSYDFV